MRVSTNVLTPEGKCGVGHLATMRNLMVKLDKIWAAYSKAQQTVVALGRDKKQMDAADSSEGLGSTAFDDAMCALAVFKLRAA